MLRRSLLVLAALCGASIAHGQKPVGDPIPAGVPALTGRAAQDSAPAQAFAALLQAAAKNDFAAIRPMLVENHPGARLLNPTEFPAVRTELLPNGASATAVMATLSEVYTKGDDATLVFDAEPGQTIWKMKRLAGGWKLSP